MTAKTPLRIASNTKTFVAATVLRLWEQNKIDLDASIAPLIAPELGAILVADGYDTAAITVRQLLQHSAGLYDHASDPRYIPSVLAQPDRRWSREELVRLAASYGDPKTAPGTEFSYSDTGYVLLGDIIERLTGKPLAQVVRSQLKLDTLGFHAIWWEEFEPSPESAIKPARQWYKGTEVTEVDPSMDLYGGGGLLASAQDLALFMRALFEHRIFDRPQTLAEMLKSGSHKGAERYRLGLIAEVVNGRQYFFHSGFWGTLAYYSPQSRLAVAGVTSHQEGFQAMRDLVLQALCQDQKPSGL